jgi:hypothetical protein
VTSTVSVVLATFIEKSCLTVLPTESSTLFAVIGAMPGAFTETR